MKHSLTDRRSEPRGSRELGPTTPAHLGLSGDHAIGCVQGRIFLGTGKRIEKRTSHHGHVYQRVTRGGHEVLEGTGIVCYTDISYRTNPSANRTPRAQLREKERSCTEVSETSIVGDGRCTNRSRTRITPRVLFLLQSKIAPKTRNSNAGSTDESWEHAGIRLISPPPIVIVCPTKKCQQARSKFGPNGTSTSNTRPRMGQRRKIAQPSEISIPVSQGRRPTKRYPLGFVGSPIIHHKSLSHSSKSAYDGIRPTS